MEKKEDSKAKVVAALALVSLFFLMHVALRNLRPSTPSLSESDLIITDIKAAPIEYQLAYHRAILLLLFSVVSFELLAHTSIVEAAMGPFKLNDLGLLQKYCPLVVAYSYCSISSLGTMRHYMRDLIAAVMAIKHESIAKNSLDVFLQPPSLFLTSEISQKFSDGILSRTFLLIEAILVLVLMTGPVVFLWHAFYQCFLSFGFRDVNVWVSLILSLFLVFQAVLLFVHHFRNMSPPVQDVIGSDFGKNHQENQD